jgi:cytosine/adenosine deaminase-related metal-dependent hydrolase
MKILACNYLVTCDEAFRVIEYGAIAFDEKIIDIGTLNTIKEKYDAPIEDLGENSVIMPGLINTHVHLEFSSNKTTLEYGNFLTWLYSVMKHRDELIHKATNEVINNELNKMIQYGTTTIGAISSYNFDLEPCVNSPLNVVYFNEVLGSKPEMIDTLFDDFKARLKNTTRHKSSNFIPAVAIHAPYSTHPFLIREILKIARENNYPVSAHFLESPAEKDWLENSMGEFEKFFKDMLDQHKSLQKPSEFLDQFKGVENLSFTHCVEANDLELAQIRNLKASIIHCPNSNRLLNNSILNLSYLDDIPLAVGTDGLSSNHSLNLFDEIRNAFYMHSNLEAKALARTLLEASTSGGAQALGLNKKGKLKKGYDSDIISFNLPDTISNIEQLEIAIILHTNKTTHTYIGGKDETI